MMLAIETATDACSIALGDSTRALVDHRVVPRQHNRLVLGMIDDLLARAGAKRADLRALAIGRGPGSFTGVRIAASIAQGLALALDLPVASVSTLEVLAHGVLRSRPAARGVVATIGATASQRYLAAFEAREGALFRVVEDCAVAIDAPPPPRIGEGWLAAGPDHEQLCDSFASARAQRRVLVASGILHPSARDLLALGQRELEAGRAVDADLAVPVYLDGDGPWRKRTPG
jgi:tRNA threonylcarbamoyladenosine biosynthesis protein TsaB